MGAPTGLRSTPPPYSPLAIQMLKKLRSRTARPARGWAQHPERRGSTPRGGASRREAPLAARPRGTGDLTAAQGERDFAARGCRGDKRDFTARQVWPSRMCATSQRGDAGETSATSPRGNVAARGERDFAAQGEHKLLQNPAALG